MPSIQQIASPVALESLRRPIRAFTPQRSSDEGFKTSMIGLTDLLEEIWDEEGDETLESNVVWTALYSFPALTRPGPNPAQLVKLAVGGVSPEGDRWNMAMDAETADTLDAVQTIIRILRAFEPPGFTAALWRAVLLAIYDLIRFFVALDDRRNTELCLELLDAAEAMADQFSGRA